MLEYKTKHNCSPRRLPRIYFCAHPQDFDLFFEETVEELHALQSCAVWYYQDRVTPHTEEEREEMKQMQLFVIPVTSRLLHTPNRAVDEDFAFAIEQHIPILPLMQEQGLEDAFAERCGNVQFLSRYNEDSTTLGYREKLRKFIQSVIVGDELSTRIRDEFHTSLFLSYRKKDRYQANRLMQNIHQVDFCRDVAIWYDEYLVPGEDFNHSIEEALLKSPVFVLTVTPNLVNEDNYVRSIEYPMARNNNKRILCAEMVPTDKVALSRQYPASPTCTAAHDADELRDELKALVYPLVKDKLKEPPTPEHDYLIGLAYLRGVDVEINHTYALERIMRAANQDHTEAVELLIHMYAFGEGVSRDVEEAIRWRERLVTLRETAYRNNRCYDTIYAYAEAAFELGNMYYNMDRYRDAVSFLKDILFTVHTIPFVFQYENDEQRDNIRRYESLMYGVLADAETRLGHFENAESHLLSAVRILEDLNRSWSDGYLRRNLSVFYRSMAQLHKIHNHTDEALSCYQTALSIQEETLTLFDDKQFELDVALTHLKMSEIYRLKFDCPSAVTSCQKAIERLDELMRVYGERDYLIWKIISVLCLFDGYRIGGQVDRAIPILEDAEQLLRQGETVYGKPMWEFRFKHLYRMTQAHFLLMHFDKTIFYGLQALQIQEEHRVIDKGQEMLGDGAHAGVNFFVGLAYIMGSTDKKAGLMHCEKAVAICREMLDAGVRVGDVDFVLYCTQYASFLAAYDREKEAKTVLTEAEAIAQALPDATIDPRVYGATFSLHSAWGRLCLVTDDNQTALQYYQQAERDLDLYEQHYPHLKPALRGDRCLLYCSVGLIYAESDSRQAAAYFNRIVSLVEPIAFSERTILEWDALATAQFALSALVPFWKRQKAEKIFNETYYQLITRFSEEQLAETTINKLLIQAGAL